MKNMIKSLFRFLGYDVMRKENYREVYSVKKKLIRQSTPILFDIGAHYGTVSQKYRHLFPTGIIHAFEPFPKSFEILTRKIGSWNNVFIHNLAISDKEGLTLLNSNPLSAANSILSTDPSAAHHWGPGKFETMGQIRIKTTTLDSFCTQQGISHIDLLKLDIQGAELLALMGAKELLAQQAISIIYFELIFVSTYQGQSKAHDCLRFLDSFGYELLDIYNPVRWQMQLIQADLLFVNRNIKNSLPGFGASI